MAASSQLDPHTVARLAYTEVPIEVSPLDITQWNPMWDSVLGDVKGSSIGIVVPILFVLFI